MYQNDQSGYQQPWYDEESQYVEMQPEEQEVVPVKRHTIFKPRLSKPNFIVSTLICSIRVIALFVVLAGLALAGIVFGIAKGYMETAPTLNLALLSDQDKTSFLYDAQGNVITDYKGTENRVMVSISMMPQNLCNAFVAVEDARFYTHNGIDLKRIVGSFISNFVSGTNQGGSTITQQLIKNTVLSAEQSYKRKIQEAYLAMQLETCYTKAQILECYLNTIYLGENYYGVEVASQGYFGKSLSQLTLRECAMLAGMTNSPYYYNPRRNFYTRTSDTTDYKKITNDRTDYVLRCMYENEFITQAQYQEALDPATANVLQTSTTEGEGMYKYAHYVEYAVSDIVDCFLEMRDLENTTENRYKMENELRTGGYHVTLAIDTEIQTILEETLANWNKYPSLRDPSDKIYRARSADGMYQEIIQPQVAAVVMDYRTGEIKAMCGSRTTPTQRKTLNRATDMRMPVGSSIKPIAVYAPAIELGASPATIVYNMPLPIKGWTGSDGKDSWPRNYGGGGYVGPQTLRQAMKRSHNVSAAQTLVNYVGVETSAEYLMRMGVDRKNIDVTPYGLSLGSSGITPLQESVAFGTLANGGVYQKPISFLGISDSNGHVVYDSHAQQLRTQVFRPSTAWLIVDMMKDVVSGGTATSAKISGQTVAGKTGTNTDSRGVTFCGLTGWYVSAIWIGHDNYKPLSSKATGGSAAAPLWQSYMSKIHKAKGLENRDIIEADPSELGLVKVTTCAVSGQLATSSCRNDTMGYGVVSDYWYEPTVPTVYCQMHQSVKVCADTSMLPSDNCRRLVTKGIVVIPNGHPLSTFVNDKEYGPVLTEYLGIGSAYAICAYHQGGVLQDNYQYNDPTVQNVLIPDARQLIDNAYDLMGTLDSSSALYANVQAATNNLQVVITNPAATTSDVAAAMAMLTQAMTGY